MSASSRSSRNSSAFRVRRSSAICSLPRGFAGRRRQLSTGRVRAAGRRRRARACRSYDAGDQSSAADRSLAARGQARRRRAVAVVKDQESASDPSSPGSRPTTPRESGSVPSCCSRASRRELERLRARARAPAPRVRPTDRATDLGTEIVRDPARSCAFHVVRPLLRLQGYALAAWTRSSGGTRVGRPRSRSCRAAGR